VASIAAEQPGLTVADTLVRLRCRDCDEPAEIVILTKESLNAGTHCLPLRIEADACLAADPVGLTKKAPAGCARASFRRGH
jgi:hypothetical protein